MIFVLVWQLYLMLTQMYFWAYKVMGNIQIWKCFLYFSFSSGEQLLAVSSSKEGRPYGAFHSALPHATLNTEWLILLKIAHSTFNIANVILQVVYCAVPHVRCWNHTALKCTVTVWTWSADSEIHNWNGRDTVSTFGYQNRYRIFYDFEPHKIY